MLRVWHGKGDKFRETPVPRDLATTIRTVDDVRDAPTSSSLVEITVRGRSGAARSRTSPRGHPRENRQRPL